MGWNVDGPSTTSHRCRFSQLLGSVDGRLPCYIQVHRVQPVDSAATSPMSSLRSTYQL